MELGEVGVGLEYVEQVEGQLEALLVVVAQRAADGAEERLVLEHVLHVLVREAQVQQAHGSFHFPLHLVLVEALDVGVQVLNAHAREVYLGAFHGFLVGYESGCI